MMIYEVRDLSYTYPGSRRRVLDHVSLTLEKGQVLSILGPNGAGKSTLLGCMIGLLSPSEGTIRLKGENLAQMKEKSVARIAGYVPQNHNPVFGYTVFEFVLMGRVSLISTLGRPGEEDRAAARLAMEQMGLSHLAERPYNEISGGERQQAAIARAIVRSPEVVLFDEPTAHLDVGNQLRTMQVIKSLSEQGYATVVTTHNPDHAFLLGGQVAILDRCGHLTQGSVEETLKEETLKEVYQADLRLRYIDELQRRVCLFPNLQTR